MSVTISAEIWLWQTELIAPSSVFRSRRSYPYSVSK